MSIRVADYTAEHSTDWDEFVGRSKNGTFMLKRQFMDYHSDRFVDASIVVYRNDQICAVLPGSRHETAEGLQLRSHGGLTYGGFVFDERMTAALMLEVTVAALDHYRSAGFDSFLYKPPPHIYHTMGAEEDLWALFCQGAQLIRRDVAAAIFMPNRAPVSQRRKRSIKRGHKYGIRVDESLDWAAFMAMQEARLIDKYGVRPVHTAEEMHLLHERFPDRIRLFTATCEGELIAGAVVFDCEPCAHVQYISSTDRGRELGGLDMVFDDLIETRFPDHRWFDFGISTESEGRVLNAGLAENKESWGARSVVYDHYLITL